MQEALRQGCRRSARLLQRAAASSSAAHQVSSVVAAGNVQQPPGSEDTKRRRRRPLPRLQLQGEPSSREGGTGSSAIEPLGSLTNKQGAVVDAAAGTSAGVSPRSPTAKKPRSRQPQPPAAAPAPASAAAAAEADAEADAKAPAAPAAKGGRKGPKAGSSYRSSTGPTRVAEQRLWAQGCRAVAGVDEAGRGPLAGPVVAAAAVLPPELEFEGLMDSKQMSEADREQLFEQLTTHPDVAYAVAVVDHTVIDTINILQAALLAMQQAVEGLAAKGSQPDHLLIDGNRKPPGLSHMPLTLLVKGDASSLCIAAASVIAKVTRDRLMLQLDQEYPQYGFAQHKGYGVPAHKAAIAKHGPCPIHRRSFEPIKTMTGWAGYPKQQPKPAAATEAAAAEAAKEGVSRTVAAAASP